MSPDLREGQGANMPFAEALKVTDRLFRTHSNEVNHIDSGQIEIISNQGPLIMELLNRRGPKTKTLPSHEINIVKATTQERLANLAIYHGRILYTDGNYGTFQTIFRATPQFQRTREVLRDPPDSDSVGLTIAAEIEAQLQKEPSASEESLTLRQADKDILLRYRKRTDIPTIILERTSEVKQIDTKEVWIFMPGFNIGYDRDLSVNTASLFTRENNTPPNVVYKKVRMKRREERPYLKDEDYLREKQEEGLDLLRQLQ